MIRSFIGIPLPDGAVRRLEALQNGLPVAREVPAENLHLTLAFLDDQPEWLLRGLSADLETINCRSFDIRLAGVLLLGGKTPGAIAVGADGGEALTALQARVTRVARDQGVDLRRRRFRPHVTIFRLSKTVEATGTARIQDWLTANATFAPIDFEAWSMALYASHLTRDGAIYEILAEYPFERCEN